MHTTTTGRSDKEILILVNETARWTPQEVAFRLPGKAWARKICRTERAFDRLIQKLADDCAEVFTRPADGSVKS